MALSGDVNSRPLSKSFDLVATDLKTVAVN